MELIDRTKLLKAIENHPEYYDGQDIANWKQKCIDEAPTVDAVEIIRCRDCVCMGKRPPLPQDYRKDAGWCMSHGHVVLPNDFCSYGEAGEENHFFDAGKMAHEHVNRHKKYRFARSTGEMEENCDETN